MTDSGSFDRAGGAEDEAGPVGKRGRKSIRPDPGDGPTARFAHELAELKRSCGDPSYDRMRTEFGAAASKSALSAAARGEKLPSWETTWEFVRSLAVTKCGEEERGVRQYWRNRWERAGAAADAERPGTAPPEAAGAGPAGEVGFSPEAVRSGDVRYAGVEPEAAPPGSGQAGFAEPGSAQSGSAQSDSAQHEHSGRTEPEAFAPRQSATHPVTEPEGKPAFHRRYAGVAAVLVAVLGVAGVSVALANRDAAEPAATEPGGTEPGGPRQYPLPGDAASPGSTPDGKDLDVTVPDGTTVHVDQSFTKTWRLKNTGTVPWDGRKLLAFGDTSAFCESPKRVPVPHAEPGQVVDVSVPVTPKAPGTCLVVWKMVDQHDHLYFPADLRPVRYEVNVVP